MRGSHGRVWASAGVRVVPMSSPCSGSTGPCNSSSPTDLNCSRTQVCRGDTVRGQEICPSPPHQLLPILKASAAVGWGPAAEGCVCCRPCCSSSELLREQYVLTNAPERTDGELLSTSPRTKARTAEQSRWEDAIQKGKAFQLWGKERLREGVTG